MAQQYGVTVDGLSESIKLLSTVDDKLRKEAGAVVRKAAVKLKTEAQARMNTAPGVSRSRYGYNKRKLPKGAISHRATATKGSISVMTGKYPTIGPAEFGWGAQFIPYRKKRDGSKSRKGEGRFVPQSSMKRRTFPIFRGNQSTFKFPKYGERRAKLAGPGWIVQPVLRKRLGVVLQELDEDMQDVFNEAARRAGIPR